MKRLALVFIIVFTIVALLVLASSCSRAAPPVINNFTISPSVINAGDTATMQWNVTGATTVSIDPGIGNVALSGSEAVLPTETTTYTLTATGSSGTETANVIVTVNPAPPPVTPIAITTFSVEPSVVTAGQTATLQWNVTGATTVSIDPGIGNVALSGSDAVSPTETTTYTLTAKNSSNTETANVIVAVNPAPPPVPSIVITAFSVEPSVITAGQAATLQWNVTGATTVSIDPGIGNVALSGSEAVSPTETTTYIITASNDEGSMTATAVLTVNPMSPPPIVDFFNVTPDRIDRGSSATLEWDVTGADSVFIDQDIGNVPVLGSQLVSPDVTVTYTLTASNSAGTITATAILEVIPRISDYHPENLPVVNSFYVNPPIISLGSSATLDWNVAGAERVDISTIGEVASSGSRLVSPSATTSYTLTASNSYGTVRASAVLVINPATNLPGISVFDATPGSILAGQSSTLRWEVSGATTVFIDQDIGTVPASGTRVVSPVTTTIYTLTATNNYGSVTALVTVVVSPSSEHPVIESFSASPPSIVVGQSSTLQWEISGATSVSINQGIGSVPASGTRVVSPTGTTTYTLTATNSAGSVTTSVTVRVSRPSGLPTIISFTATPATIVPGQSATLKWEVSGATSVVINQGIGPVSASGTIVVAPIETTIYTLTVSNSNGVVTHSVQIIVIP
jgi:hypothetical protein